jgi:dienelactone hydrolase
MRAALSDPRRIVVVGSCASGKSSLVAALASLGYDAHVCGQEHSIVRELWRHSRPDVLIALAVDLSTIRRRRSPTWPESIYAAQQERLASAFAAADLVIDTIRLDLDGVIASATDWLRESQPS